MKGAFKRFYCAVLATAALAAASPTSPGVIVSPETSMTDARVSVRVSDRPRTKVAVTLTTRRFGMPFQSTETMVVPETGSIDVTDMKLFWTVMPSGPPSRGFAFRRDGDLDPATYVVSVDDGKNSSHATLNRISLSKDVVRTVVDSGALVATLFSRKDGACRPGVVVLGGSEGGVPEQEAAIIAPHGFTTLALAYYGMAGLPRYLENVPVESVANGIAFLKSNRAACASRRIGVIGGSKGAELALVCAARYNGAGAVVAVAPASVVFGGIGPGNASSWTYRGKPLPFANGAVPKSVSGAIAAQSKSGQRIAYAPEYRAQLDNNRNSAAIIRVESISAPLLLVAGGSDALWPSLQMARNIMDRRKTMAIRYPDALLTYPDAGHQIGIPYQFAKAELAHASLDLGGTAKTNEAASEDSWPKILAFLKANL